MKLRYEHLIGRDFNHGSTDCYGLARSFFKDNFNLDMTDYARPDNWWDKGMNLYMDNFHAEGFRVTDDPIHKARAADMFLVAIQSQVPNHIGVHLGQGKVLHHFIGRRSEVVPVRGIWRNFHCATIRHKDINWIDEIEEVHLMDVILPHKRRMLEDAGVTR